MIRDTSLYEPLQIAARTSRPSLRALALIVLGLGIQTGEHSSIEDARVTMQIFRAYQMQWEASLASQGPRPTSAASTFAHTAPPSSPGAVRYHHPSALSGNAQPFSINVNLPNRSANNSNVRLQTPPRLLPSPFGSPNMQSRQTSATPSSYFPSASSNAFMDPRYSAALATLPTPTQRNESASPSPRTQRAARYQIPIQPAIASPKSYANATSSVPSPSISEETSNKNLPPRDHSISPLSTRSNERSPSPFSSPSGGDDGSSEESQSSAPVIRRTVSTSSMSLWSAPQRTARKKRGARPLKKKEEETSFVYQAAGKALKS